jgi:hypothetical protein
MHAKFRQIHIALWFWCAQAEQQPKDLPLDNQHGFFFLQFCDVAKLAIIHKKKFGYRPDMKLKILSNPSHFLTTC